VLAEDELLLELQEKASLAAKRRAAALLEGVAELGTVAAVAKELGKSHTAIDNAIKRHGPKQA
jgi:molybdenum-dependent DNA-binding transcriptional regulator ModE